jgi:hypothetical protein
MRVRWVSVMLLIFEQHRNLDTETVRWRWHGFVLFSDGDGVFVDFCIDLG